MNGERSERDWLRVFLGQPRNPVLALRAGAALWAAGEKELAVAVWTLGDDADPGLRRVKDDSAAPREAREASSMADAGIRAFLTAQHLETVDAEEQSPGELARVRNAIWPLTHDGAVTFRTPMQRPVIFYAPDLPARPVTPNEALSWVNHLQSAFTRIRSEYLSAAGRATMNPYVPAATREARWSKLAGRQDWSSLHLFKDAKKTRYADQFPETLEAVRSVDLVSIDGAPLEVFFSRLRAGAEIPPHFGLTNTRLTVHLPIIVPESCAIRVGDGLFHWSEGEVIAFDDSYEHEAWNRSDKDRVVLIFEAHHPDLTLAERHAIESVYSVRQNWLKNRHRLLAAGMSTQ